MATVRSLDFLPEIFQTPVNRQFLAATLDQLIQEPEFQKTQGFVGRKVGPGVNPLDRYVIEPTPSRNDYQLEPGVVDVDPNTGKITDAITYPGFTDALKMQGAFTNNADRLYTSEFYSWDPFVDFDKFVNYQQYYWLPAGPLAVDVSSTTIPLTDDFVVTRENGVYTFSGLAGKNPIVTLVRGGNYTFQVAQNAKENINFRVTNSGTSAYVIDYENNPTLTLVRGNTYTFTFSLNGVFPFYIKTEASLGAVNTYDTGVTNNGAITGTLTFVVPQDAPDTLYYCSSNEFNMRGTINVVNGTPGTGSKFWIQAAPGINGRLPASPNISSRDVLGVSNNGEDLGTISFNAPLKTAQDFYYSLNSIGPIGLVTNLQYDQINGQPVNDFITNNNGIDGITDLEGRTLIFQYQLNGWGTVPANQQYGIWKINYVDVLGVQTIQLVSVLEVSNLEKCSIIYGTVYSSTEWYKNADGIFEQIPLLTAVKDVLYYQDGTDPEIFGQIRLIEQTQSPAIEIDEIIGARNYTSPNGVVFTNGLKVTFRGDVIPSSYQNQTYYVEGVGTAIRLLPITNFVTPEIYTQSETVPYDSTPYDIGNYDSTLNAPQLPDYLTINRASPDLNAWSRSNRWFHIDVIEYSAELNNTQPIIDNALRGRRPILEFRAGTKLYNYATEGKQPVDIIDFKIGDAFSAVNGTTGYGVDGYSLIEGSRIIFAADTNPSVRDKIYQVQYVVPDSEPPLIAQPIINLVAVDDVLINQGVVCLSGITLQGKSFYYDGVAWIPAQDKTSTNQAPLFDVYDSSGISLGDRSKYPSSTFIGSKLLGYAEGSGVKDPVLGFALRYLSLTNIGDIVFDNNLYTDTFIYVKDSVSTTAPISSGFVRQYSDRLTYAKEIGWQTAATPTQARQQFQFTYDGSPLKLDVAVSASTVVPAIQLYVNANFQDPSTYQVETTSDSTTIRLLVAHVPGDIIEVAVLSNQVSSAAFYQIPSNLSNNPFNGNSPIFTLGTVRSHYGSIAENLINLAGEINGPNNTRDLGNIIPYGQQIVQQSSPLTLTGYFFRNPEYNIFASIEFNNREYIKFKSLLLNTVIRNEYGDVPVSQILDLAVAEITKGRTDLNSFYWSDMLPSGPVYTEHSVTITPISTTTFDTIQVYDYTSSNYLGLSVYLTRTINRVPETVLLTRDTDYTVSTDGPTIQVTTPLVVGDVITIREYSSTVGNFVPNTPTKMGLYPKYDPEMYLDTSYLDPTMVIRGHDGSITVAFGDIRDQVLLEFERRIYNNIKTDGNPIPLSVVDVIPGFFRTTDYSQAEINQILGQSFLSWVGWNKLDYKTQDYIANNPFTYNYSTAGSKLDAQFTVSNKSETPLPGAWRGIYKYFYDTTTPNTTPWEMLGLSEKPLWWEERYGPAPYTQDNFVLWDDLELGLVADPIAPYILPQYARPGLTNVIPTGSEGDLLAPLDSVVGLYDPNDFRKSWVVGDGGPVEASWWTSSSYPFAIMNLLALTRPAEFFNLFVDRDLYRYDDTLGQYLYKGRYRYDASATNSTSENSIQIYGEGASKASYINWIIDYNQQLGRNSTTALTTDLANLDVRLCYRMASFTNKQYLKIFTEKSSPNSQNSSLLLPDDSYSLLLYKNQPFNDVTYSALTVERVANGYAVYGFSTDNPYFEILASAVGGSLNAISAGGATVRVPSQYTDDVVQVPYGFVFTNTTMMVDFILSYGAYLESQGLIFTDRANGYQLDWTQMAKEFLYFSQQGWSIGTLINLNPVANKLVAVRPGAVVDTIESVTPENMLLDQNRRVLPTRDLIIDRNGNEFSITSASNQTIAYLRLRFTNYEHMVVLDNISIFQDLIYDPITAARQNRLKISASTSTQWNGQLDAQGFILNQHNVEEWNSSRRYTKGEIVLYKNIYWSAQTIVQPKIEFDYNDWVKADYTLIQEGLLPNIANKADQLANSYNTYSANLERDNDLLSYGLIGFRPREYMTALNLDDVSQVNVYQQFLGSKGTIRSAELFTRADLGKESGEYAIYENWAILASTYGANANRSFFELRLNRTLLQSNPSVVQVINPQENSDADQTILVNDIWRESFNITSPDILPTTTVTNEDTALPSAGYVNVDDIDITVFTLDDPSTIAQYIDSIGIGTIIWVAKTNAYDWNIYRCEPVPGKLILLSDNLNSTSVATFSAEHGLSVGDLIIVRYFNDAVNGVYRVLSVPTIQQVIIAYEFVSTNQTAILGDGLVFYLQTARVAQASDISKLPYANTLEAKSTAWVDNDGSGRWEVLQKQNPFTTFSQLTAGLQTTDLNFGQCVDQTDDHFMALVGAPGASEGEGSVYSYCRDVDDVYTFNIKLSLNATDVGGFGSSLEFGNKTWSIIGAPTSRNNTGYALVMYLIPGTNDFIYSQLLLAPDQNYGPNKFGSAVTMSQDERWMYISAPVANRVYAYGRVEVEEQSVIYVTDGVTFTYNYSNYIQIDFNNPGQLVISLANLQEGINVNLTYAIDYQITATSVILLNIPTAGLRLNIKRRQAVQLDNTTYYGVIQNTTSGIGTGAAFTINVTRGVYYTTQVVAGQNYDVGDTLTINGAVIGGTTPANNLTITVTSVNGSGGITGFTDSGSGIDDTDTFQLSQYLYTATNIESFKVEVNGVLQRPHIDYEFNNDSTEGTQDLTFVISPPTGASISVATGSYWSYVSTLTVPGLSNQANFGSSLTTTTDGRQVLVGCSFDSAVNIYDQTVSSGSVYAFDRSVVKTVVTDPTQTTYPITGSFVGPISVLLNNEFLTNTADYINGQFTLVGSDIVLSDQVSLTVGDILEIETNQFNQIQKIVADTVVDEASFGFAVDICPNNCSVYTGAPHTTINHPQEGLVQRNINQSRVYGVTTSTIANPSLTEGDTIRINDTQVSVPASGDVAGLVDAINAAKIPNVVATLTPDVDLVADGVARTFDVGSIYSQASSYTTVVYLDDVLQTSGVDYTYNSATKQITFTFTPYYKSVITVISGRITISIANSQAAIAGNKLTVLPGVIDSTFDQLGFVTYTYTQTLTSPNPSDYAYFGYSVDIDNTATNLIVGAPNGNIYREVTFDGGDTYFDDHSTTFFSPTYNSGVAYTYNLLPSAKPSASNPGMFVFGEQLYDDTITTNDNFGISASYRSGRLLVGAPGNDQGESNTNYGIVSVFSNPTNQPSWSVLHVQQPVVNIAQINSVFMYDRLISKVTQYFDYFDPLQGKILGAARRNIDYIGAVDPADYSNGIVHNFGNSWANEHVGEIWWDTDTVRFINPNQDNITYASRRWGQVFPGSRIDIYQWVSSTVPPLAYTGPGIALSTTSYTASTSLNEQNILETRYYFWVRGLTTIDVAAGKTLSTTGIASYIENPRGSGIPYIAPLDASTVAIYNALDLISAQDTILHIEYDKQLTDANVHQEYNLIAAGRADSFLNDILYRKLQDSFCGVTTTGASVPDPALSPPERYGVQFRPRQSMFVDRFAALKNYLERANKIFTQWPIAEMRRLTLLNSSEPEPYANSGEWNKRVANLEELSFQNLQAVPLGYRYLVVSDSSQQGLWTIYELVAGKLPGERVLDLVRVQNYDTRRYWKNVDWYSPGYNSTVKPVAEVQNYSDLATLTLNVAPIGSSVKVTANARGKFEIYLRTATGWDLVGIESGTIQINEEIWNYSVGNYGFDSEVFDAQYFDQEPVIETRKIIQAINEEIFIDELLIERNRNLMLMFDFVYSEFAAPEWLIKTSLIDVNHNIRALRPFQNYLRDNQDFVLDYIQEVKPYHVQIREFNLTYSGDDTYPGMLTDFDSPAFFDNSLEIPQFVSPILLPYTHSTSAIQDNTSDTPANAEVWSTTPWNDWYNNYLLTIQDAIVIDGGEGYTIPPDVTVTGECVTPAVMTAIINSAGRVVAIEIVSPGVGYRTTAVITLTGGNGIGAKAVPVMGNNLIRSIRTVIKYDRYQYQTTIVDWEPNVQYDNGTQVRYLNKVWEADSSDSSAVVSDIFDLTQWTLVDPSTLSGVDRTMGLYVSTPNLPGLSLPLLIDGVEYPGVQVAGPLFSQDTGFDIGNFDVNPFDNISYGPEGRPTYDPAILDTIYESQYLDVYLGIDPAPAYNGAPPNLPNSVVVDGGAYIDTYSSYAPEELVPGSEFDTLDMRVYTRAGADWMGHGHGFPLADIKYNFDPLAPELAWAYNLQQPDSIVVTNATTGVVLTLNVDYTIDWIAQTVTIIQRVATDDLVVISAYRLGGGNQLFENTYTGSDIDEVLIIPVSYNQIQEFAIFVNGQYLHQSSEDSTEGYTYAPHYATTGVETVYNPIGSIGSTLVVGSTLGIQVGALVVGTGFSTQTVISKVDLTTLIISSAPDSEPNGMLTFLDNTGETEITFTATYTSTDAITLTAIGPTEVNNSSATINYSWSTPQTQVITVTTPGTLSFALNNSLEYTNPDNLIVSVNGVRARTSAGIEHYGDDVTVEFPVAGRLGFTQDIIADNEIRVYVDEILLVLYQDYTIDAYDPFNAYEGRRVVRFATAPATGSRILLAVNTNAQCVVNNSQIVFNPGFGLIPVVGDEITVTTWNDTRQQDLLTQVFVGPVTIGVVIAEGYSQVAYDEGDVNNEPGSFDYTSSEVVPVSVNDLQLDRVITNPDRLWVTLNGRRLFNGYGFTLSGTELILTAGVINVNDVVMVTLMTDSIVPAPMAFRIFQDMRGVQATYRITPETTTTLAQDLTIDANIVYVTDASALGQPDVVNNSWGVVTINGERIMYRERDTVQNTISSLLRGTAGTAATYHTAGAEVYDLGRGNLMPAEFQNYVVLNTFYGDGVTREFITDIVVDAPISTPVVEIYVGGTALTSSDGGIPTYDPVTAILNVAPAVGVEVVILVRRGVNWYNPGIDTPSDGTPLQDTDNQAARFLRGQ